MAKRERNQARYKRLLAQINAPGAGYACHWCGATGVPLTIDHLVERDAGGTLDDGWVAACKPCNSKRGAAYVNKKYRRVWGNPLFR